MTGRFLIEATWSGTEHAALAIRDPGVVVEAVEVLVPVETLANLVNDAEIRTVRIAATPEEAGELTEPRAPAC